MSLPHILCCGADATAFKGVCVVFHVGTRCESHSLGGMSQTGLRTILARLKLSDGGLDVQTRRCTATMLSPGDASLSSFVSLWPFGAASEFYVTRRPLACGGWRGVRYPYRTSFSVE